MNYRLRELSRDDMPIINEWRNDKELISFLGAPYRYIDVEIDNAWFDNYLKNRNNTVRCSIIGDNNKVIGLVSLTDINYINRSANFHIMIGNSNNQNKGAGQFAVKEMINHAFNNINLNRIQLEVLSTNERAIHIYKKNGFVEEGTLRKAFYKDGTYQDVIVMGLLKDENNK